MCAKRDAHLARYKRVKCLLPFLRAAIIVMFLLSLIYSLVPTFDSDGERFLMILWVLLCVGLTKWLIVLQERYAYAFEIGISIYNKIEENFSESHAARLMLSCICKKNGLITSADYQKAEIILAREKISALLEETWGITKVNYYKAIESLTLKNSRHEKWSSFLWMFALFNLFALGHIITYFWPESADIHSLRLIIVVIATVLPAFYACFVIDEKLIVNEISFDSYQTITQNSQKYPILASKVRDKLHKNPILIDYDWEKINEEFESLAHSEAMRGACKALNSA